MKHSNKQLNVMDMRNESIRAALLAIAARSEGRVNPHEVVEQARDPASVLHEYFEWDDDEAGKRYRLTQAEALIRRVKLSIMRQDPGTKEITMSMTRAFQNRASQRKTSGSGYEEIDQIMADEGKRADLLNQVLRELESYRKRYSALVELADVWTAIDDSLAEIGPLTPEAPKPEDRPTR